MSVGKEVISPGRLGCLYTYLRQLLGVLAAPAQKKEDTVRLSVLRLGGSFLNAALMKSPAFQDTRACPAPYGYTCLSWVRCPLSSHRSKRKAHLLCLWSGFV